MDGIPIITMRIMGPSRNYETYYLEPEGLRLLHNLIHLIKDSDKDELANRDAIIVRQEKDIAKLRQMVLNLTSEGFDDK